MGGSTSRGPEDIMEQLEGQQPPQAADVAMQAAQQPEQQQLAAAAAPTPRSALDVWSVLQAAASTWPDRLAVADCGAAPQQAHSHRLCTYAQLRGRALHLVGMLSAAGVAPGARVALMMRNHVEVMEVHYAAAALHAVVVNVNTNLAPPELAYLLGHSGAEVLIAGAEFQPVLAAAVAAVAAAAAPAAAAAGEADQKPLRLHTALWADCGGGQGAQALAAACVSMPGMSHAAYPHPADPAAADDAASGLAAVARLEAAGKLADAEDGFHLYYTSGTTGRPKVGGPCSALCARTTS